jgi:hypothetical protein
MFECPESGETTLSLEETLDQPRPKVVLQKDFFFFFFNYKIPIRFNFLPLQIIIFRILPPPNTNL